MFYLTPLGFATHMCGSESNFEMKLFIAINAGVKQHGNHGLNTHIILNSSDQLNVSIIMITVNSEEDIRFHTPYIWPHDQATLLSLSSPYLISITFNLRWQTVTRVHYNLNTCKYPGIRSTKYLTLTLPLRTAMKPQIIREYQIECIVSVPKQILLKTFLYW